MGRPWYPMYWSDFTADTAHLTLEELGAYVRLLARYYSTGKPLDANAVHLHKFAYAKGVQECTAVDRVAAEFFTDDGLLRNKRADEEIEKARAISDLRSSAAKKRWAMQMHSKSSAKATQPQPQGITPPTPRTGKRFKRPTVEEVRAYCAERENSVNAQDFVDHYDTKGWVVGKSPMKDWKACVRTWERRRKQNGTFQSREISTGLKRPRETDTQTWLSLCKRYDVKTYGKTNDELWRAIQDAARQRGEA